MSGGTDIGGGVPQKSPAALTAYLHVQPDQVSAHRLRDDSVGLTLGDDHASVSLLGDLDTVIAVVGQALDQLAALREAGE